MLFLSQFFELVTGTVWCSVTNDVTSSKTPINATTLNSSSHFLHKYIAADMEWNTNKYGYDLRLTISTAAKQWTTRDWMHPQLYTVTGPVCKLSTRNPQLYLHWINKRPILLLHSSRLVHILKENYITCVCVYTHTCITLHTCMHAYIHT